MTNWHIDNTYPAKITLINTGNTAAIIKIIETTIFKGPDPWTFGDRDIRFDEPNIFNEIRLAGGREVTVLTHATVRLDV